MWNRKVSKLYLKVRNKEGKIRREYKYKNETNKKGNESKAVLDIDIEGDRKRHDVDEKDKMVLEDEYIIKMNS